MWRVAGLRKDTGYLPANITMVQQVDTEAEWERIHKEATAKNQVVIIDFTATWCGPCRMIGPFFAELAEKYASKAVFIKVDVDQGSEISEKCGISAMPTFMVFKGGKKQEEFVGADKNKLQNMIEKYVK
eukprot:jgi/Mesvir1/2081/Mv16614-RA.1